MPNPLPDPTPGLVLAGDVLNAAYMAARDAEAVGAGFLILRRNRGDGRITPERLEPSTVILTAPGTVAINRQREAAILRQAHARISAEIEALDVSTYGGHRHRPRSSYVRAWWALERLAAIADDLDPRTAEEAHA